MNLPIEPMLQLLTGALLVVVGWIFRRIIARLDWLERTTNIHAVDLAAIKTHLKLNRRQDDHDDP